MICFSLRLHLGRSFVTLDRRGNVDVEALENCRQRRCVILGDLVDGRPVQDNLVAAHPGDAWPMHRCEVRRPVPGRRQDTSLVRGERPREADRYGVEGATRTAVVPWVSNLIGDDPTISMGVNGMPAPLAARLTSMR